MCSIKPYYSVSFPGIKAASPKCNQLNPITLSVFPGIKAAPKMYSIKPYYSMSFTTTRPKFRWFIMSTFSTVCMIHLTVLDSKFTSNSNTWAATFLSLQLKTILHGTSLYYKCMCFILQFCAYGKHNLKAIHTHTHTHSLQFVFCVNKYNSQLNTCRTCESNQSQDFRIYCRKFVVFSQ